MQKICKKGKLRGRISPLCNNWLLYGKLKGISNAKGVSFDTMLSVSYAESHLGVNFAPSQSCSGMNNRGGIKGMMDNNGKVTKVPLPYKGCRLYPFQSIEDYRKSLANTLKMGYADAGCKDIICLSKKYVGDSNISRDRVNRVNKF